MSKAHIPGTEITFTVSATFEYTITSLPDDPDNPYLIADMEESYILDELSKIDGAGNIKLKVTPQQL